VTAYVDVDRDVERGVHPLTFNYCVSEHGCDPNVPQANSPQVVFYRYGTLGGTDFGAGNMFNTLRQNFTYLPGDGQNVPVNMRSMGAGVVVVFPIAQNIALNAQKRVTASVTYNGVSSPVATLTINPPANQPTDSVDIAGRAIPTSSPGYLGKICEYLGQPGMPGPNAQNPCGAYQMPIDSCSSGLTGANAINKAYMLPIEDYDPASGRLGNSIRLALTRDSAMSLRFKTKDASTYTLPRLLQVAVDEFGPNGANAPRFISISEKRCDFDYNKLDFVGGLNSTTFCYKSDTSATILAAIANNGYDPSLGVTTCQLKPNTTYYFNMRYEFATKANRGNLSCPNDAGYYNNSCGAVIGFN
jgi:hypothetical protein